MALKDVVGQDRAVGILFQTIARRRLPSGYLFAGDSGIGKKFTAMNLAKTVNCQGPGRPDHAVEEMGRQGADGTAQSVLTVDACDSCPSCRKIDAGLHPDVMVVVAEKGEIRVDDIRAVEDALSYKPFEGRRKTVIIDDADTMNQSAANAFLKTLEEPPEESLIILITSNPERLPETIRSRCSVLKFTPLSPGECEKVLVSAAGRGVVEGAGRAPSQPLSGEELTALVRLSMGKPGDALSSNGLREREHGIAILKAMVQGDPDSWADRADMERWFAVAEVLVRDMVVLTITGSGDLMFNSDRKKDLEDICKRGTVSSLTEAYHAMRRVKEKLDFNLNKGITWNYTASVFRRAVAGV